MRISLADKRMNCLRDQALGFGVGGRQKACFARQAILGMTATPNRGRSIPQAKLSQTQFLLAQSPPGNPKGCSTRQALGK